MTLLSPNCIPRPDRPPCNSVWKENVREFIHGKTSLVAGNPRRERRRRPLPRRTWRRASTRHYSVQTTTPNSRMQRPQNPETPPPSSWPPPAAGTLFSAVVGFTLVTRNLTIVFSAVLCLRLTFDVVYMDGSCCPEIRVANDHDLDQIFVIHCPQQSTPIDYRHNRLPAASRCSTTPTRILKSIMISESSNRPGPRSLASLPEMSRHY